MNHPITEYKTLNVEQKDKIVIISLNRPNDANGMNYLLAQELRLAAQACDGNSSIKAVVLTGMGRFFCAGGDVKAMAGFGDDVAVEIGDGQGEVVGHGYQMQGQSNRQACMMPQIQNAGKTTVRLDGVEVKSK